MVENISFEHAQSWIKENNEPKKRKIRRQTNSFEKKDKGSSWIGLCSYCCNLVTHMKTSSKQNSTLKKINWPWAKENHWKENFGDE